MMNSLFQFSNCFCCQSVDMNKTFRKQAEWQQCLKLCVAVTVLKGQFLNEVEFMLKMSLKMVHNVPFRALSYFTVCCYLCIYFTVTLYTL